MLHNYKLKKHKQSKYFTIMLVPSSSGKTRSLKIPLWSLQGAAVLVFVLLGVSGIMYLQANHLKTVASQINNNLEESEKLNMSLREESEDLSKQLQEEKNTKKISENMIRKEVETAVQAKDNEIEEIRKQYEQYYEEKAKELESKLEELDRVKDEIYNKLSAKPYLPEITRVASLTDITDANTEDGAASLAAVYETLDMRIASGVDEFSGLLAHADTVRPYLDNYPTSWPVSGKITSEVGYRQNPQGGSGGEYHSGVDISVSSGTNVKATGGGTVTYASWMNGYGYLVIINHGFGLETYYAHNSKLLVSKGDKVSRGDILAKSGSTGISTGPHVHYEVRKNGNIANPKNYIFDK